MAEQLVNHFLEVEKLMEQYGFAFKSRILTDYLSGRSDRVVVEWEYDSLGDMEQTMTSMMNHSEAQKTFPQWERQLIDMINYSKAENWTIRK